MFAPRSSSSLALMLVAAGCGGHADVQLVQGVLLLPSGASVRAFAEGALTGASTADASGRFVLALPAGQTHVLYVRLADGTSTAPLGGEAGLQVCEAGGALDLGTITIEPDPTCPPAVDCEAAQQILADCQMNTALMCEALASGIEACHAERDAACAPMHLALERCLATSPECPQEEDALALCLLDNDCAPFEQPFFAECVRPCRAEQDAAESVCPQTPTECAAILRAIPEQWTSAVGCEVPQ